IGHAYQGLGDYQKALEYFDQALLIKREAGDRRSEAVILSNIGLTYNSLRDYRKALEYFNQSLPIKREIGDRHNEVVTLAGLAAAENNLGNLASARNHFESALSIVESLRTKISDPNLRSSYYLSVRGYFERYIDLLMSLHRLYPKE